MGVWQSRPAHADRNANNKIAQIGAVHSLDMTEALLTKHRSRCVEETMTNRPTRFCTTPETRPGSVLHSDVPGTDVPAVDGAVDFIAIVDKAAAHVSICHFKIKSKAAGSLKQHSRGVERSTDFRVRKVMLDDGKEYIKGTMNLKANGIEVRVIASFTSREKRHADRIKRIIQDALGQCCYIWVRLQTCGWNVRTPFVMRAVVLFKQEARVYQKNCLLM